MGIASKVRLSLKSEQYWPVPHPGKKPLLDDFEPAYPCFTGKMLRVSIPQPTQKCRFAQANGQLPGMAIPGFPPHPFWHHSRSQETVVTDPVKDFSPSGHELLHNHIARLEQPEIWR